MSWFWKNILRKDEPWRAACVAHDRAYWRGGTQAQRLQADIRLRASVAGTGHPVWAFLMFWAVRVFGSPYLPLPWRWGFGQPYGGGYRFRF
ncbi:MAG: hypothetical protein Q4C86_10675 [bacterium]|nr:hypothetical protein [bacterium]